MSRLVLNILLLILALVQSGGSSRRASVRQELEEEGLQVGRFESADLEATPSTRVPMTRVEAVLESLEAFLRLVEEAEEKADGFCSGWRNWSAFQDEGRDHLVSLIERDEQQILRAVEGRLYAYSRVLRGTDEWLFSREWDNHIYPPGLAWGLLDAACKAEAHNLPAAVLLRKAEGRSSSFSMGEISGVDDPRIPVLNALIESKGFGQALAIVLKAQEYYPEGRTPGSPYYPELREALAWAQIGGQAQAQFKGMRRSFAGMWMDLGRFVGKSGDNDAEWELLRRRRMLSGLDGPEAEAISLAIRRETECLEGEFSVALEKFEAATERLAEYRNRRCSMAQKAIDLQFQLGNPGWTSGDAWWINEAPLGLVKRAHKALCRGVSEETVWLLVAGQVAFGRPVSSREELEFVQALPSMSNVEQVAPLLEQGVELSEIAQNPWALALGWQNYLLSAPEERSALVGESILGLAGMHGEFDPERVGELVLSRVRNEHLPQESNPHDAGMWLSSLRRSAEIEDTTAEVLVLSMASTGVIRRDQLPGFSKKPRNRVNAEISAPMVRAIGADGRPLASEPVRLEVALEAARSEGLDLVEVGPGETPTCRIMRHVGRPNQRRARALEMFTHPSRAEAFEALLDGRDPSDAAFGWRLPAREETPEELLQLLTDLAAARKAYADDAWRWVQRHSSVPGDKLARAWSVRPAALAAGTEDSVQAILTWAETDKLASACERAGITLSELPRKEWAEEVVRCYSGDAAVKFLLRVSPASEAVLPAWKGEEGAWTFEVLSKDDPRGATIGYDTGCCMTLGGFSKSCIYDGYSREDAGFVALSRRGRIVAQSFFFVEGDVLVLDNIEAGGGRDFAGVLDAYKVFLKRYLEEHPVVSRVHLGTGYTEINFKHLPRAPVVMPTTWKLRYSDAKDEQRLLLDLAPKKVPAWEEMPF